MARDEKKRDQRAKRLRAEIERLRSGADAEVEPKSPREFLERAAREKKPTPESDREGGEKG